MYLYLDEKYKYSHNYHLNRFFSYTFRTNCLICFKMTTIVRALQNHKYDINQGIDNVFRSASAFNLFALMKK